jgi:hypothetical protein
MNEVEEEKKLSLLLAHWIEHNKEHAQDFKRWADKAKTFDGLVYEELIDAVKHVEEVNESLSNALKRMNIKYEGKR